MNVDYWIYRRGRDYFIYKALPDLQIIGRRSNELPHMDHQKSSFSGSWVDTHSCKLISKEEANKILRRSYYEEKNNVKYKK